MELKLICILAPLFLRIYGYSNDCPHKCFCGFNITTCDGAINPQFQLNWRMKTFQIENGYLNNLKNVLDKFRNLQYLVIRNMEFFNCTHLMYVPDNVHIRIDDCILTSERPQGKNIKFFFNCTHVSYLFDDVVILVLTSEKNPQG